MRSDEFKAMLDSGMRETREDKITIEDFTAETVNNMIAFIYEGKLEDETGYNDQLFMIAHKYGLKKLMARCESLIARTINDANAVAMWRTSDLYEAKIWKQAVVNYLSSNWKNHENFTGLVDVWASQPQLVKDLLNQMPLKDLGRKNLKTLLE